MNRGKVISSEITVPKDETTDFTGKTLNPFI